MTPRKRYTSLERQRATTYANSKGIFASTNKELFDIAVDCYLAGGAAARAETNHDINGEEWRPISPDYEVSNYGRVRSVNWRCHNRKRLLSCNPHLDSQNGYVKVRLNIGGHSKNYAVHRLVADAFVSNPNNYTEVDHIDGDRSNNHAENLRWCTHQENMSNPNTRGNAKEKLSGITATHWKNGCFKSICREVAQYSMAGELVKVYDSTRQAERETGFSCTQIAEVANGKRNTCHGFIFKYTHPETYTRIYKNTRP